jgi:predicted Zn-dependent peptidase
VALLRFGVLLCLGALLLPAQELRDYEKKVTEFTLANGLHFIVLERHQVPVVSFDTYVNVGSAQDPAGQSGMSRMLERLAFKGTETVGTRNWPAEKKALEDMDAAYDRVEQERNKGARSNQARVAALEADVMTASTAARDQQNPDEFGRAVRENGGVDVRSKATPDAIETTYSLPSNRIELWFLLESQRLSHPVFRDFYRERESMVAEISNPGESRSQAGLKQILLATAFQALPYRNPVNGWPADVANLRRSDARAFFETWFVPGNIVIGVVGDVDPAHARSLAERYFAPIPPRPLPPVRRIEEPPQLGPKSAAVWGGARPLLTVGYKRPGQTHRDDAPLDVVGMILGNGRSGWLYKELVEEKGIAQGAEAEATFPSGRYASLFLVSVMPAAGHTVEENRKALDDLVARLQAKPVDAAMLARLKNVIRGRIARTLGSNQRLATLLPSYYVDYGDWRRLFTASADYDRVTAEDVQQVALRYLVPANRTVAYISGAPQAGAAETGPGGVQ